MPDFFKKVKTSLKKDFFQKPGRGERIRTSDSYVPNVVLYQAELHPDFPHMSTVALNREGEQF